MGSHGGMRKGSCRPAGTANKATRPKAEPAELVVSTPKMLWARW
jgi:hypothetical protein